MTASPRLMARLPSRLLGGLRFVGASRPLRGACWLLAAYAILGFAFEHAAGGLLTPGGVPRAGAIFLGGTYVALRVLTRFALPALLAFGVLERAYARLVESRKLGDRS